MLTVGQRNQCLSLLVGGLFIDNGAPYALALVYRAGPPDYAGETNTVQPGVAKYPSLT
jgi:hypothetical protein